MLVLENIIDLIRKSQKLHLFKKCLQPSSKINSFFSTNSNNTYEQHALTACNRNIGIIGASCEEGQLKPGVALGPKFLRDSGLITKIQKINESINIKDYGDIVVNKNLITKPSEVKNMLNMHSVLDFTNRLSEACYSIYNDQRMCITLGGDHSIAIGSINGHLRYDENIAVIWVDAHADLNTNATSPTGNMHGMTVALLVKELINYWPFIPEMNSQKPILSIQNLAYIGLRCIDTYERVILDKFNVHAFGMREIDLYGIKNVFDMALKSVDPENKKHIHLSFDIDALDILEASSTGTPVRGGLSMREGIYIMEQAHITDRLTGLDLVEVNPKIGSELDVKHTIKASIKLIQAACGHERIGNKCGSIKDIPKL